MDELTSWSRELTVEIAGHDVINHAGAAALRILADRSGLTSGLSRALASRGFVPVHDRGRVLADRTHRPPTDPPTPSRLRTATRAYQAAFHDLARHAHPAA